MKHKIPWTYKGESGVVEYDDHPLILYALKDGNDSCDCNKLAEHRLGAILTPEKYPELYYIAGEMFPDQSGVIDETFPRCGEEIKYDLSGLEDSR